MFEYVAESSKGKRDYQEDSFGFLELGGKGELSRTLVCVVADGMGGHVGGAAASAAVVKTFLAAYAGAHGGEEDPLKVGLREAVAAIARGEEADPALHGMGSTLVAVVCTDAGVEWLSVGDSPLWMMRAGVLHRLNADHSMKPILERMVEAGEITKEQAASDPQRHHLRSAITKSYPEVVDRSSGALVPLQRGDTLLIASDGILSLAEGEICEVFKTASDPPDLCAKLLQTINTRGLASQDNSTVMLVRRRETGPRPIVHDDPPTQPRKNDSPAPPPPPPPIAKAAPPPKAPPPAKEAMPPKSSTALKAGIGGALVLVPLLAWLFSPGELPPVEPNLTVASAEDAKGAAKPPIEEKHAPPPLPAPAPPAAQAQPPTAFGDDDRPSLGAPEAPVPAPSPPAADGSFPSGRPAPKLLTDEPDPPPPPPPPPPLPVAPAAAVAAPVVVPTPKPPVTSPPPPAEKEAFLLIRSTPPGAFVWIDGKSSGATGDKHPLSPGTYSIELRKSGYVNSERVVVRLEAGATKALDIALCQSRQKRACHEGSAWWFDGCAKPEVLDKACTGTEVCTDGACKAECTPGAKRECINGSFYNFDSCGVKDPTPAGKCGAITPPPSSRPQTTTPTPPAPAKACGDRKTKKICKNDDVWWVDGCGTPSVVEERCQGKKKCATRGSLVMCK